MVLKFAWIADTLPKTVADWLRVRGTDSEFPCPTGQFCWLKALGVETGDNAAAEPGDIIPMSQLDHLREYDGAFITGNPGTWHVLPRIKEVAPDVTLFATADYALGAGGLDPVYAEYPDVLKNLSAADVVYSVEPRQHHYLDALLPGQVRKTNNPVDVDGLMRWAGAWKGGKRVEVAVVLHPYGQWRTDYPTDYAYLARVAGDNSLLLNCPPDDLERARRYFPQVITHKRYPYPAFLQFLLQSRVVWNVHAVPSADRVSLECMAMGVPVVGTPYSAAPIRHRPDPWDIREVGEALSVAAPEVLPGNYAPGHLREWAEWLVETLD